MRTLIPLSAVLGLVACTGDNTGKETGNTVILPNNLPVAEAGPSVTQTADTAVQLNGGGSSDADGESLTYHWSFDTVPDGSALATKEKPFTVNETSEAIAPAFSPDRVGTYIVKLIVNDGKDNSSPDYVVITVTEPTTLPVANAGADATAAAGAVVTLDGAKSYDPQGRTLTYAWTLVDKPTSSALTALSSADSVGPTFTPDARGNYTVNLVVNNGLASSTADAAVITVTGEDGAPVANAGGDQSVEDCTTVNLNCSASVDPDGDLLKYFWQVQAAPGDSTVSDKTFSDATSATPTFYPDVAGTYVLSCAVNDGKNWSTPDLVTLTADERRSNSKPVADAGADQALTGGNAECTPSGYVYNCDECADQTLTIGTDARASDPDGDPYTIAWTVVEGDATLTSADSLTPTAKLSGAEPTEPGACEDVEYHFQLAVTDCTGETTTDTVVFTVSCCGVEDSGP